LLALRSTKTASEAAVHPAVPTTLEAGYANSDTDFWVGMFASAKTRTGIVERLNRETVKVLSTPKSARELARNAAEPMIMTSTEFETNDQNKKSHPTRSWRRRLD